MFFYLAAAVDALHALLMVAWIGGLPLLFWHRYPALTRWYGRFAIGFVVLSQGSQKLMGECFLTAIARALWLAGGAPPPQAADEWFTIRFAQLVFHLTPSRHSITVASELFIVLTAVGALYTMHRRRAASAAIKAPDAA